MLIDIHLRVLSDEECIVSISYLSLKVDRGLSFLYFNISNTKMFHFGREMVQSSDEMLHSWDKKLQF